jgi:hypothetical protein
MSCFKCLSYKSNIKEVMNMTACNLSTCDLPACEVPAREMFPHAHFVQTGGEGVDYFSARKRAGIEAQKYLCEPMLMSWYGEKERSYFPHELSCCEEGNPSWVSYAHSRGGDTIIDVNDEEYVFIFRGEEKCC